LLEPTLDLGSMDFSAENRAVALRAWPSDAAMLTSSGNSLVKFQLGRFGNIRPINQRVGKLIWSGRLRTAQAVSAVSLAVWPRPSMTASLSRAQGAAKSPKCGTRQRRFPGPGRDFGGLEPTGNISDTVAPKFAPRSTSLGFDELFC
jgi:hypothetical protein